MAKRMTETEKPGNLAEVVLHAAKKAVEALADNAKKPLPQQSPEKVLVADSTPPKKAKVKPVEPRPNTKASERKTMSVVPLGKLDTLNADAVQSLAPGDVVRKAAEVSPQFAGALGGKPIRDEALQLILAEGITKGKSLPEIARDVQQAVLSHKIKSSEGSLFTVRVASLIENPDSLVQVSGGAGSGGAPDVFGGLDYSALDAEDQAWIRQRIDFANANPKIVNRQLLENWTRDLESRIRRMDDPQKEASAASVVARMEDRIYKLAEARQIPNTITLTHEEVEKIIGNPIGFMESYAQDIEELIQKHGFDSPVVEQRLNRYRLISDFFSSEFYDERVGLNFADIGDRETFTKLRSELLGTKETLLRQYSDRLHAMEFSYHLSHVSDFEKDSRFQALLDRVGDTGALASRTQWGALSEVMLHKIRRIHGEMLRDPATAQIYRSLPEVMESVLQKAAAELHDEAQIWNPYYQNYLKELVKQAGPYIKLPPIEEMTLDEKTCKAVARIAHSSYQMFFEKEEVMTRGAHPALGELFQKINKFITANTEEKMLATFRIRDWFYRKWTNMLDGQKAVWNLRSLHYVHKDPELSAWAREKTGILWDKIDAWKHAGARPDDSLLVELKTIFSEYESKLDFGSKDEDVARFFSRLKRDKLYHYVAIDIGGEWAQMHAAKPYGFWGSGVRRNVINREIENSPLYRDHANKLFEGRKILDSANAHFHPGTRRRSDEAKDGFVSVLRDALKSHPHTFYKMRSDELQIQMGDVGGTKYKAMSRRFDVIQSQLRLSAITPIDYTGGYNGLTGEQKMIVNSVFASTNGSVLTKEQYFDQMSQYIQSLSDHMDQFAHVRYAPAFSFILWTDDIPLAGLEAPITVKPIEDIYRNKLEQAQKNPVLSEKMVEGGSGRNGLWRRAWGDFIVASTLVPVEIETLTNDEKQFTEAIVRLAKTIPTYQSHTDGAIAVLEASAGFLGAAKVKGGYSEYLKWMKNSSVLKDYWGDESLSLGLDEISHTYDKFQALVGKLRRESPAYAEAFESYVGVTNYRWMLMGDSGPIAKALGEERFDKAVEWLNESVPNWLYLYKGKNAILFGLIIIALFAVDQARRGGQEAKE